MRTSRQRLGGILIVVAAALLLSLGVIEGALRLTFKQSELYRGLGAYPDLNRKHYELQFVESRVGGTPIGTYDPDLGWDMGIAHGRVRTAGSSSTAASRRVLTIGDSFTYGAEVQDDQTFSYFLERDLCATQVLNMGVGGYGIDQAVLKYLKHGAPHRPAVIVLGIHPPNYERTSVPFFSASKPVFRRSPVDGTIALANHPVPDPASETERIGRERGPEIYTWSLARAVVLHLASRLFGAQAFFDSTDAVVEHALSLLMRDAAASNARILVVHIPLGQAFLSEPRWHRAMSERLLALYRKLGLRVIDLGEAWRGRLPPADIVRTYYVSRPRGPGHLSEAGNRATAALIADVLKEWGFARAAACAQQGTTG